MRNTMNIEKGRVTKAECIWKRAERRKKDGEREAGEGY